MSAPGWLTPDEAAKYSRMSTEAIRRACRAGTLRAVKKGQFWRVRPEWVDTWMEQEDAA